MTSSDNTDQDLREQLYSILDDIQDYWLDEERWFTPLKKGELSFEEQLMALFTRYKDEAVRLARIDELEKLKPSLVGAAREYDEHDLVTINYELGYVTAQKALLDRLAQLKSKDAPHE